MGDIKVSYNYTQLNISGNEIADTETGDRFDISNSVLLKRTETGKISISYPFYNFINSKKLIDLIVSGIKEVDLALLICMSANMSKGENICLKNNDDPHSTGTIAEMIGQTIQATKAKINRLIKLDLLHYGIVNHRRNSGKVYVVNPNILKNGILSKVFLKEFFKGSSNVQNKPNMVLYDYDKYFHIDTNNIKKLINSGIKLVDLALLITMSSNLEQEFNICLDQNDKPHTSKSLSKLTKSSQKSVKDKLDTLVDNGFLYHGYARRKKFGKVYIINLHFVKETQSFDSSIRELFNDF